MCGSLAMFWVMTLVRSTYSPIKNIVRIDIVMNAFFDSRTISLNRAVSELKVKMIKINTIIEIFKMNILKLVNISIKDEIKIVIPSKSKNKRIFIFSSSISNKLIGVFSILKIETRNKYNSSNFESIRKSIIGGNKLIRSVAKVSEKILFLCNFFIGVIIDGILEI